VGIEVTGSHRFLSLEDSLEELTLLARTAGADVVDVIAQRVHRPSNTYVGSGKLEDISTLIHDLGVSTVIFDDELSPTQQQKLEEALSIKIIDRTALIIDIFAKHALSREGRLQVELAQSEYLLPRLAGQWSHLERLGGGIGTRGPGESQLETDRRLARGRIQKLRKQLEAVRTQRALHRDHRKSLGIPVISMVGYTNAGKSTLMNALSHANVLAEDKLFATLDPITRRITLPNTSPALLTDTVGFIQKLPPTLVAAFRATLEELDEATVLLHVVDITHPNASQQAEVVDKTLVDLGLADKPRVVALNKMDLAVPDAHSEEEVGKALSSDMDRVSIDGSPHVMVSAARGWGLKRLLETIQDTLGAQTH